MKKKEIFLEQFSSQASLARAVRKTCEVSEQKRFSDFAETWLIDSTPKVNFLIFGVKRENFLMGLKIDFEVISGSTINVQSFRKIREPFFLIHSFIHSFIIHSD